MIELLCYGSAIAVIIWLLAWKAGKTPEVMVLSVNELEEIWRRS